MPWQALCEVIEPHYPKAGNGAPADRTEAHAQEVFCEALVQLG